MDSATRSRLYRLRLGEELNPRRRENRAADIERFRLLGRERIARWRAAKGEEGKRARQEERRRIAEKKGKRYLSRDERKDDTALRKAEREYLKAGRPRKEPAYVRWVKRLQEEEPALYDSTLSLGTLEYRARYHLDPKFRDREIERSARAKGKRPLLDDGSLTATEIRRLFSRKRCPYCGDKMESKEKTLDHILPRHLGGWHSIRNVVACCFTCNVRKKAKQPEVWLHEIGLSRRGTVERLWNRITNCGVSQRWLIAN